MRRFLALFLLTAPLAAALAAGTIAGALSDVFEAEPLPEGHPLWDAPRHIVTPHLAGYADVYHQQAAPIVAANMASSDGLIVYGL